MKRAFTVFEVSERFIEEYFKDIDALGIKRATIYPRATQVIDDIISFISDLSTRDMRINGRRCIFQR